MTQNKKKTVDELLNEVDYSVIANYRPKEFSLNVVNFIKLCHDGHPENATPPVHYMMLDALCDKRAYLANLCHRGLAKTSLFAKYLFFYLAVFRHIPNFGLVENALFVGDSVEKGCKNLVKNMKALYNSSRFLQQMIPEAKFTEGAIDLVNADGEAFGILLFGSKTGVRGTQINNMRPVLAVLDDLVSEDDAKSSLILSTIKETIYANVLPAMHPTRRKIIFNGTPFNKDDPIYEAVESGAWNANVYPVCEEFPCKKKDFKGSWEERFTYESLERDYELAKGTGKIKQFRQELLLRIASEDDRLILDSDILWFNTSKIWDERGKYYFYITSDFATSTNKKADYTVVGVWAVDSEQNRYLMGGFIGRQTMDVTFNGLFSLVQKYCPESVGIEVSGQQNAFIALLRQEMSNRNIYFNFARSRDGKREGIPAKANKMERFRLSIPYWKSGKIWLPENLKDTPLVTEILEEITLATIDGLKSKHDDAIDMISQLEQMYLYFPDKTVGQNEVKQLSGNPFLDYLERLASEPDGTAQEDYL